MSSMDNKLIPQNTITHWDLAMDAEHHLPNQLFPFASAPTWPNYPPLPPPIIHHHPHTSSSSSSSSSSSFLAPITTKQMETLAAVGEEKEVELAPHEEDEVYDEEEELGPMKEMMYKIAAMQPVEIDPATIRKPKRRNVRISEDPQSIAARLRRERISEKIRILQRLVPGGTKLDTASMLDEAVRYVKFLKRQIRRLQHPPPPPPTSVAAAAHIIGGELPLCFTFNEG